MRGDTFSFTQVLRLSFGFHGMFGLNQTKRASSGGEGAINVAVHFRDFGDDNYSYRLQNL